MEVLGTYAEICTKLEKNEHKMKENKTSEKCCTTISIKALPKKIMNKEIKPAYLKN